MSWFAPSFNQFDNQKWQLRWILLMFKWYLKADKKQQNSINSTVPLNPFYSFWKINQLSVYNGRFSFNSLQITTEVRPIIKRENLFLFHIPESDWKKRKNKFCCQYTKKKIKKVMANQVAGQLKWYGEWNVW